MPSEFLLHAFITGNLKVLKHERFIQNREYDIPNSYVAHN
jgi:hypothetical protein